MENTSIPNHILVMKYGGSSVGSPVAMKSAVKIICETKKEYPNLVVVTSAISGATDALIKSATDASSGNLTTAEKTAHELTARHHELIDKLVEDPKIWLQLKMDVNRLISEFVNLCNAIKILGELSPRALDAVSSLGERLSVRILSAAVESAGIKSKPVESTQLIITDDVYQSASPDMELTSVRCKKVLYPILNEGITPIVTGFIGATKEGSITTLGRGGSDYSASIIAVGLEAEEVWIWTDVTGVMSADPRIVPDAKTIPALTYNEVSEMAYYGAKVLHPKSVKPCVENGIKMRICNTFAPQSQGTILIHNNDAVDVGKIKAVTTASGFKLITVSGAGMDSGMNASAKIFNGFVEAGVNVPMVIESSSEQSLCFPIDIKKVNKVEKVLRTILEKEISRKDIDEFEISEPVDILTVICSGLKSHPEVITQVLSKLIENQYKIKALSYGASDVSLNIIVSSSDSISALKAIHQLISF
ncbi:MAG TPA: aspartate kinase [Flexilinea sp.]|nr:MAG: Bifunctional aspartokinase/homoserine dehydrogenase 1 [Chloroflexi bacterium ADurb.Bin344]HOG20981.1 aspartate kinase [Flexilinea sp.]HOG60332.1 aspartate kinase [Flexilinea sp.]HOR55007.1 aspartate kinase [Flexilinea sp.]HOU19041.1 aspartate kinase [Flexilinea sp.]